ncbi:MAG: efflux RND transporter periplasmic adaptor subunit [Pseudomonadota bacterium]
MIRDTAAQDAPRSTGPSGRRWLWITILVVLVATGAFLIPKLTVWASAERSVASERLRTAVVQRDELVRDISVQGQIVAAVSPTLYAPAAGTVTFTVQAGANVTEGQRLALVDSPELTNRLEQERAVLAGIETSLARSGIDARTRELAQRRVIDEAAVALTAANREYRRAQAAQRVNAISAIDYERSGDDLERARLIHEHAEAEAELLNDLLAFERDQLQADVERQALIVQDLVRQVERLELTSPVTGMVGNLLVNERAYANANEALMSVVDLSAFEVEVRIPESSARDLSLAMPATVRWGQNHYEGELVAISPEISERQVTARIRFLEKPPQSIRQNQRVAATILLERKPETLLVPRGPFFDAEGGRFVYVIDGQQAVRRPIVTGSIGTGQIEILDGLNPGERIVISDTSGFDSADVVLIQN